MKKKEILLITFIIIFFSTNALFWYGYDEDIYIITKYPLVFLLIPIMGFLLLYIFNYRNTQHKIIFNILITIGIVISLSTLSIWYLFKDFGF